MKTELLNDPATSRRTPDSHKAPEAAVPSFTARLTRLLVPLDFSLCSQKALDYAVALAERSGTASIHLLHVVEPYPECIAGDMGPVWIPDEEAAGRCEHELAGLAKEAATPRLPISSAVHLGRPAAGIVAVARETRTDLVVIGTHGRTGLQHLLLGSVAERVVREAPCPVLVVRAREHEFIGPSSDGPAPVRLRKILVPTDFSPAAAETVRYAVDFARSLGGKITLAHTVHLVAGFPTPEFPTFPGEVLLEDLREKAERRLLDLQRLTVPQDLAGGIEVRIGPPLAQIPEMARSGEFDLIICATHGYTGLKHALLGSTAEGIVRHAPCPVLIVRKPPLPAR